MAGTTQATVAGATPAFAKRKARALIGWLTEEEGSLWLAGRNPQMASDAAFLNRCRVARATVAGRAPHVDSNAISQLPAEIDQHVQSLRLNPWGGQIILESGEPALVDLRQVRALQPVIHIEDARKRVAGIGQTDLGALAELTIPIPPVDPPDPQAIFDQSKQAHLMVSPSPNLRVMGPVTTLLQIPSGARVHVYGFAVGMLPSIVNVIEIGGRFILRDGYHRSIGCLESGITHVPALVKRFATWQEARIPPMGMLSPDVTLGDHPPLLPDYLDERVSAETMAPLVSKMVVIQGLELTPLG